MYVYIGTSYVHYENVHYYNIMRNYSHYLRHVLLRKHKVIIIRTALPVHNRKYTVL